MKNQKERKIISSESDNDLDDGEYPRKMIFFILLLSVVLIISIFASRITS